MERFQDSLYFEFWNSRQQLGDAYKDTYKWIWKNPNELTRYLGRVPPWNNFLNWLQNGSSIYWIHGKAGSGKSTLLNYVRGDQSDRLGRLLNCCAESQSIITPTFFFRRNGQPEQRSITGLIESLILQILEKAIEAFADDLTPILKGIDFERHSARSSSRAQWRLKELTTILQNLTEVATGAFRICFFIDGIDEFEGDATDQQHLVEFICEMAQWQNTKVCVSSRPDPHLIQTFRKYPQLKLQDLNRDDIGEYISGNLAKLQVFSTGSDLMNRELLYLTQNLLAKAQGVFLWVRLAVNSLIRGSQTFETLSELHQRVENFDESLHGLFRQLIDPTTFSRGT